MEMENEWEPITHLVKVHMSNIDGLCWQIRFGLYFDKSRTNIRGGDIGYIDHNGKIVLYDNRNYKVAHTKQCNFDGWKSGTMFFRRIEKRSQS